MKETFYFTHDYNAIQDPKMMRLLSECGLAGIGMYWIIIELLHQQPDNTICYQDYSDYIDFYGRIDYENEQVLNKLKQVFISVGLFIREDDLIYSKRVLENKKQRQELSEKRSLAGKKSAEIRGLQTSVEQVSTSVKQGKERKGKEIKRNTNIDIEEMTVHGQSIVSPATICLDFFNNINSEYRAKALQYLVDKGLDENTVKEEMLKFISYWTELNSSGKKQRWETEKTFEVNRRLATWFSNRKQFNKQGITNKAVMPAINW